MLAQALHWRFDDNRYPRFGPSVIKLHRAKFARGKRIVIIRDPRDVAVSYFHHHREIYADNGFNTRAVALGKSHIFRPEMNEDEALDAFVTHTIQSPISPPLTWGAFYQKCRARGDHILRYEDLRSDPVTPLERALDKLEISVERSRLAAAEKAHDIETVLTKRGDVPGMFFARCGKIGEGKTRLSTQARALIEDDAGDLLAQFGYEL
ncbi:MAG: hypothetical protein ACJA2X_001451 [Halocynthiibacter sp.]|jgi:hypothetical protein